jgi:hypothetical protein
MMALPETYNCPNKTVKIFWSRGVCSSRVQHVKVRCCSVWILSIDVAEEIGPINASEGIHINADLVDSAFIYKSGAPCEVK